MQVSSLEQSYLASIYADLLTKTATSTVTSAKTASEDETDIVTLSSTAQKLPPPPHEMDFESMTDEELKEYLQQMYDVTGTLPGGMEGTVDGLSEEALAEVRATLIDMSANSPISAALENAAASGLTGENYKTLITMFLMEMQTSLTTWGSSDADDSWFSSGSNSDLLMQALAGYLQGSSSSDEDTTSLLQQALSAYQSSMSIY